MFSSLPAEAVPNHADNAVLRQAAADVSKDEFKDGSLKKLLGQLVGTLEVERGVGLAAPQIGVSKRVFIMSDPPAFKDEIKPEAYEDRDRKPFDTFAVINPRILDRSTDMVDHVEGCLSIKGYAGIVRRHKRIEVEFLDESWNLRRSELEGYIARIFQHEFDHLDGILFSDETRLVQDTFVVAPANLKLKDMTLKEIEAQIADGRIEKSSNYPVRPIYSHSA